MGVENRVPLSLACCIQWFTKSRNFTGVGGNILTRCSLTITSSVTLKLVHWQYYRSKSCHFPKNVADICFTKNNDLPTLRKQEIFDFDCNYDDCFSWYTLKYCFVDTFYHFVATISVSHTNFIKSSAPISVQRRKYRVPMGIEVTFHQKFMGVFLSNLPRRGFYRVVFISFPSTFCGVVVRKSCFINHCFINKNCIFFLWLFFSTNNNIKMFDECVFCLSLLGRINWSNAGGSRSSLPVASRVVQSGQWRTVRYCCRWKSLQANNIDGFVFCIFFVVQRILHLLAHSNEGMLYIGAVTITEKFWFPDLVHLVSQWCFPKPWWRDDSGQLISQLHLCNKIGPPFQRLKIWK